MPPSNQQNTDVFGPSDRAQMLRLTDAMERLANVTNELSKDFDQLKDGRIMELIIGKERTNSRIDLCDSKIERLEKIIYGLAGTVSVQAVAIIGALIQWFITK